MDSRFLTLQVTDVVREDSLVALQGTVSVTRVGTETWIGDRHIGYLKRGIFLARGRWRDLGGRWSFALDRSEHLSRLEGTPILEVLDGYWGARAEVVLDTSVIWNRHEWTDPADHHHCAICWATISMEENREHYAAERGDRVCAPCYDNYVMKRALGFIPSAAQQGGAAERPPDGR